MTDAKFIPGLFFKDKHENAPDFVICKGSIKVADLAGFLAKQEGEWVNFDLKRSRDGKPYASVDDWKASQGNTSSSGPRGGRHVSWARVPASKHAGPGARFTEYRLFRRDLLGAWHYEFRRFIPDAPRDFIARELRMAKRELRDRVDELDLARMEGEAA